MKESGSAGAFPFPKAGPLLEHKLEIRTILSEKERHETFGILKRFSALYRFICACGVSSEQ